MIIGGYPYWWNPYPYYYPYPYAYPLSPPLVDPEPPVYIEQAPAHYWYYCRDPQGYYPYVSQCPGGWLPVAPLPPAPPGEGR